MVIFTKPRNHTQVVPSLPQLEVCRALREANRKRGYEFWQPKELFILYIDNTKSYVITL